MWVDATPFRAHLGQLLATGLTEPVIARLAGVSVRAVEHLAHGRRGRPVRRICDERHAGCCGSPRRRPRRSGSDRCRCGRSAIGCARWPRPAGPCSSSPTTLGLCIRDVQQVDRPGVGDLLQLTALKIAAAYELWETEQEFPGLYAAVALTRRHADELRVLVVVLALATGLLSGWLTPVVLRRLAEPPTDGPESATTEPSTVKIPYAQLATARFGAVVGLLAAATVRTLGRDAAAPSAAGLAGAGHGRPAARRDRRPDHLAAAVLDPGGLGRDGRGAGARQPARRLGSGAPRRRRVRAGRRGLFCADLAGSPRRLRLRGRAVRTAGRRRHRRRLLDAAGLGPGAREPDRRCGRPGPAGHADGGARSRTRRRSWRAATWRRRWPG